MLCRHICKLQGIIGTVNILSILTAHGLPIYKIDVYVHYILYIKEYILFNLYYQEILIFFDNNNTIHNEILCSYHNIVVYNNYA